MKSPSSRYLTGYFIRAVLGTALVLCAISTVRIRWVAPEDRADPSPPWDKALILPDQLVLYAIGKLDERLAAQALPPADSEPPSPPPGPTQTPTAPPPSTPRPSPPSGMPDMPSMPAMPDMPGAPKLPEMPSMPGMPSLSEPPPSARPSPATKPKSTGEWGVTIAPEASVYGMDKKRIGRVPAGTLLKVIRQIPNEKDSLVVCTIVVDGKRVPEAVVRKRNTAVHKGPLTDTTSKERDLRVLHARLLAGITMREAQLRDGDNPHKAAYTEATRTYKQFALKNNALLKEYETATGDRRMKITDELRELKLNRAGVTRRYETAREKYTEWKEKNPETKPDFKNDPKLERLRQEVAGVKQKLSAL